MKRRYPVFLVLGVVMLLGSCAKEGPRGPTGLIGPSYTGNISGHVSLYDQYGSKVLRGLNSVLITLSGDTSTHPDSITGYYNYANIITGNYNIIAADSGYGTTVLNSFQYLSATLNKDIKLSAVPTFSVTLASAHNTGSADSLVITCTADAQPRSMLIFINNIVYVDNNPVDYLLSMVKAIPANATKVAVLVPAQSLYDLGFTSGSTVYYAVYSAAVNDFSAYEDLNTGKTIYNAVSNPTIDSAATP